MECLLLWVLCWVVSRNGIRNQQKKVESVYRIPYVGTYAVCECSTSVGSFGWATQLAPTAEMARKEDEQQKAFEVLPGKNETS